MKDYFGYAGKKVVITGAASGMGFETTKMLLDLGAEVYALDLREVELPVKESISVNLGQKEAIDSAIAQLPEKIDKIFSCAGVAGVTYAGRSFSPVEVNMINFVGPRYFIEGLIPRMSEGGAIAMIASIMGGGWIMNMAVVNGMLMLTDWDKAREWLEANQDFPKALGGPPKANRPYAFSKECVIMYTKLRSFQLASQKIRINTLSPGVTLTPMAADFGKIFEAELAPDAPGSPIAHIGYAATPEDQAKALIFLNSDMADYISGADLPVDYGFMGGAFTGQVPPPGD